MPRFEAWISRLQNGGRSVFKFLLHPVKSHKVIVRCYLSQTLFSGSMTKWMFFSHSHVTQHLFVTKVTSAVNVSLRIGSDALAYWLVFAFRYCSAASILLGFFGSNLFHCKMWETGDVYRILVGKSLRKIKMFLRQISCEDRKRMKL
jgi:hypothetical protein